MPEPLAVVMAAFALLSVTLLLAALIAVRRRHWIGTCAALALAFLFLALAALAATLGVATQGYRALTREVVATVVATRPTGPERFTATFTFPDGRRVSYDLTGDALYVDAHIVKWHPLANILGLHTAYQLARSLAFLGRVVVDTEYGSATFVSAREPTELELRVSTSGLLFRPVDQAQRGMIQIGR